MRPKITIITVVFNDRDHIGWTLDSVAGQTYEHIEYIIIDGGSTDGTLEIIREKGRADVLVSEPDRGLYDAMNKGLSKATGDYVWYLNSGDQVYAPDTVEQVVNNLGEREDTGDLPGVIYGGTMIIDEEQNEIGDRRLKPPPGLTWQSFRQGMVVCHQSLLVRRQIAPTFNLEYRISADIDWAIRSTRAAAAVHHSGLILSRFLEGGLSGKNIRKGLMERFRIMTQFYGFLPTLFRHLLFGIRLTNFYLRHRRI